MKIALIIDDEAWFWIHNEEYGNWEAWYENDTMTHRLPKMDRLHVLNITELISEMTKSARIAVPSQ